MTSFPWRFLASPSARQLARFLIVGCLNVAVTFIVFVLCYRHLQLGSAMLEAAGAAGTRLAESLGRLGIMLGLFSSAVAFLGVLYAMLAKWLDGHTVAGWASSVAIISFLFCMLFLFLAVLAEYVGRILEEVRGRPRFIVSERLDGAEDTGAAVAAAAPKATPSAIA